MFLTLLRKDWRIAKPAFLLMLVVFSIPALIAIAVTMYSRIFEKSDPFFQYRDTDHHNLMEFVVAGFWLSGIVAPAMVACQFGRERRERSADFIGALPISRGKIVWSKALVTVFLLLAPILAAWIAALTGSYFVMEGKLLKGTLFSPVLIPVFFGTLSILAACGLAWILSCAIASDVLATAASILTVLAVALLIFLAFQLVPSLRTMPANSREAGMAWAIAIVFVCFVGFGFVGGTLIALRRRTL